MIFFKNNYVNTVIPRDIIPPSYKPLDFFATNNYVPQIKNLIYFYLDIYKVGIFIYKFAMNKTLKIIEERDMKNSL